VAALVVAAEGAAMVLVVVEGTSATSTSFVAFGNIAVFS